MQKIDLNNPEHWGKNIPKRLWQLSWPTMISLVSFALMGAIDTFFVGQYIGKNALAGTGLASSLLWLIISAVFGLLNGSKTTIANAIGDGKNDLANKYFVISVYIAMIVGIFTILVSLFGIFHWIPVFSENPAQANAAESYYFIRAFVLPVIFVIVACEKNFEARGNTRVPMIAAIVGNVVNTILDYVFIAHFEYGVDGIAYATNIGTFLQLCVLLCIHKQYKFNCIWKVQNFYHIREIWRLGKPQIIVNFLETGSFVLMGVMISLYSATDMAAQQITMTVEHLVLLPVCAIGSALSTLVGQACGAGHFDLVKKVTKYAISFSLVLSITGAGLFLCFGEQIASLFIEDNAVIQRAAQIFCVVALFQISDSVLISTSNALRAAGDVRFTAWISSATAWLIAPPMMWFVGWKMGYGAIGGWLGIALEVTIVAIIFSIRLKGDKWITIAKASRKSVLAVSK